MLIYKFGEFLFLFWNLVVAIGQHESTMLMISKWPEAATTTTLEKAPKDGRIYATGSLKLIAERKVAKCLVVNANSGN